MKKSDITRRRLLEAAAQLIANDGIERVTARALASKAGVSPGLISRYFPQLDRLLEHVIQFIYDESHVLLRSRLPENLSAEEVLLETVKQNFDIFTLQRPHYNKCFVLSNLYVDINPVIREINIGTIEGALMRLERRFSDFGKHYRLNLTNVQVSGYARTFLEQLDGGMNLCSWLPSKRQRQQYFEDYLQRQKQQLKNIVRAHGNGSGDL